MVALAFFAGAAILTAQNADKNSAGPTKNDLKIRVTEPAEGATITGSSARVSVDYDRTLYREQGATDKGLDKFPPPTFEIFLDNDLKQTLKGGINVATIDNIPPGSHRIVILAKNISGEVIDRKQVNITTVEATATTERSTASAPIAAPPAPAPAPIAETAPAPPAAVEKAPAPPAPAQTSLPATASSASRLAVAGIGLLLAGLLLARKPR